MMKVIISILLIVSVVNQVLSFECGLEGVSSRIYNGRMSATNKYPWMALIKIAFTSIEMQTQCVGALIDDQHIVTGAQCFVDDEKQIPSAVIEVQLGATTKWDKKTMVLLNASLAYFDITYNEKVPDRDLAILKLEKPVQFSQSISPICLPKSDGNLGQLTIAGWGLKESGGPTAFVRYSSNLMEANVEYVDNEACQRLNTENAMNWHGYPLSKIDEYMKSHPEFQVSDTQMCAMNKKNGADACTGDSGGPLMHKNSDGRWVLVGIVSSSLGCGTSDAGTIASYYTRVSKFENEIKKTVPSSVWVDV